MKKTVFERHPSAMYLILAVALLIGYSPVYLSTYGFSDDWFYLYASTTDAFSIFKWDILSGRPFYGAIRYFFAFLIDDVQDLTWLRVLSLLSLILLGGYIIRFLERRSIFASAVQRLTFATLICLLPSFQVFVGWTVCFPYVLSVLLAGISYSTLAENKGLGRVLLSAICLTLSFAIYQPAAMSFLFFALIDLGMTRNNYQRSAVIKLMLMLGFGMVMALVLAKVLPLVLFNEVLARTNITLAPLKKITWFIAEPLRNALCNFDTGRSIVSIIISCSLIIVGIVKAPDFKPHKAFLFLFFLVAAGIPNLLVSEDWAAYRTVIALSLITTSAFIAGLFVIFNKLKITTSASIVCLVIAVLSCMLNIQKGFSTPQQREYQLLSSAIIENVPAEYSGQLYYRIDSDNLPAVAKSKKYDEFGSLSLGMPWSFAGMADAIKKEHAMKFSLPKAPVIYGSDQCPGDCLTLDATHVLAPVK
ncbi:glucosyltransferase domain-containing protein [Pantoea dispersa]|uniref:glucosyltransferase domain-containing protein n=1 Tax=Pantoea dispersa TaxID=59814 RepID=UPI0021F7ECE7|nr:glucosyltransferase domain-containing protein [Pantoea dispersa]UYP74338.1 glucosyltransferase domain-containing protein [Pantoea dispersa]